MRSVAVPQLKRFTPATNEVKRPRKFIAKLLECISKCNRGKFLDKGVFTYSL